MNFLAMQQITSCYRLLRRHEIRLIIGCEVSDKMEFPELGHNKKGRLSAPFDASFGDADLVRLTPQEGGYLQ